MMRAVLLVLFTAVYSCAVELSVVEAQAILTYGYKLQFAELAHLQQNPTTPATLAAAKQGIAGIALPAAQMDALLSLFRPEQTEKDQAIAAWKDVVLRDAPAARVMLESWSILGFKPAWSVVIVDGNVTEEEHGADRMVLCDRIISPRYHEVKLSNSLPLQYVTGSHAFVMLRGYRKQTESAITALFKYKPEDIHVDFDPETFAAEAQKTKWRLFWIKCYLLGLAGHGDLVDHECEFDLRKTKERLCGPQVKGFQFLSRALSADDTTVVSATTEQFNTIQLHLTSDGPRRGLGGLVEYALNDDNKGLPGAYLDRLVRSLRAKRLGAESQETLSAYLLHCPEEELRTIMREEFQDFVADFVTEQWAGLIANNVGLPPSDLQEALASLRQALPESAVPYLIETQCRLQRDEPAQARAALLSGIAALKDPFELGKLKFILFTQDRQAGRTGARTAAVARLQEISGLMPKTPEPVLELSRLYVADGAQDQAITLLRAALPRMAAADRPKLQAELDRLSAQAP